MGELSSKQPPSEDERSKESITLAMMATYCREKKGGSKALYGVEIWEKPWQNFEKYTVTKIRDIAAGK
ncbi:hypothetical protein ANCDUO_23674 [Ancylostoma duodenale]|uniref:Cystatin domain-containing protein n=1 Tax=Ancylostoma duodenale TaxID=51022 RepID=A0A0C2FCK6_9BILA|nr:hypothetical protein ANCDUO_23674 [Ancylostoma duodenale]